MYADVITLLADHDDNLQDMLNVLNDWCKVWDVIVSLDKLQIMHVLGQRVNHLLALI